MTNPRHYFILTARMLIPIKSHENMSYFIDKGIKIAMLYKELKN